MNTTPKARRIRRLCAVAISAVTLVAAGGVANAADYDDYSLTGFMTTSSGAVATAAMQCGRSGTLVFQAQGNIRPTYFSYRATNSAGATTGWMPWQNASSFVRQGIITRPGYWLVDVQITHYNGRSWTLDKEFAPVTVQPAGYSNRFWCKVTG